MSREPAPPAAQHAEVLGRNNVVVQIRGDGNEVTLGLPHLTLTRYLNRRRGGDGPSGEAAEILSPYALAIPFIGRESVMEDLWTWMEKDQPISVRVLTARGGGGKTRLGLELCDDATRKGWFAGFVTDRELQRFLAQQNLSTWGWNRPTLVVIDYAASRARFLHDWLVELADNAGDSGHPLRLLLLERHADPFMGWWKEAFGIGGGDADSIRRLLDPARGPLTLPTFGASERRAIFEATLQQVGSGLRPPETPEFERHLAELSWGGEPLFLMMAGLTAARAGLGHVLSLSPTDVVFEVARHELHRIRKIVRHRGIDEDFLAHMAAFVTLCQGLSRSQTEEAIEVEKRILRYDSVGDPPRIYEALYDALPGDDGDVAPILPDILGEAVVLSALGAGDSGKAEDAAMRAVVSGGEKALPVLIRTADDFGSVRRKALHWLERWVQDGEGDDERLIHFSDYLPRQTLALREPAAELEALLVERFRPGDREDQLAIHLNNLSNRLSALGRREEALVAIQEGVPLYRDLASVCPEDFLPDLASSLNNLATQLSALGHREEALTAVQEAVSIRRDLASACLEDFLPDLASSLNTLALRLNALGRWEEALAAGQESVSIRRDLASASPETFHPDLAGSLNNLAVCLGALGHREEALAVSKEAVSIQRDLAFARPEAFRPDLAISLHTLALRLSALGYREEALEVSKEAVLIRRDLASAFPEAFQPDLAMSLNNLALLLGALGRLEEALAAGQEAVSIRRDLASARPKVFRPDLVDSLFNLSKLSLLSGEGEQKGRAVEACREAVELLIPFSLATPVAFRVRMVRIVDWYLELVDEIGHQPDSDLLAPLVEAGFFETEPEDSTSPGEATSDPEEESQ